MANNLLHICFDPYDKNLAFIALHQTYNYRIIALFKAINTLNYNTFFIYIVKYYSVYNWYLINGPLISGTYVVIWFA